MSERALRILLAVVGGLVVLYAAAAVASRGSASGGAGAGGALNEELEAFQDAELEAVRIVGTEDTVALARTDGGWTVNGYPADTTVLARLRDVLARARVGNLAAANPDNHARLGVAGDRARTLELRRADGRTLELLLGDAGPAYPSAYVRLPGEDDVFLVHGDLLGAARPDADDWRDRTIVRLDTAAVARVTVTRDGATYTLARDSAGWTLADGEAADAVAVRDLLAELAGLTAAGFADEGTEPGEASRTIVAFSESGEALGEVRLAAGEGAGFLATTPGNEAVFELSSFRADRLAPARDDVRASDGSD